MTLIRLTGQNCSAELNTETRCVTLTFSGMLASTAKKKASPRVIPFNQIESVEAKRGLLGGSLRIVRRDRDGYKKLIDNDLNAFQEKPGHPVDEFANEIRAAVGLPLEAIPMKSTPTKSTPTKSTTKVWITDSVDTGTASGSGAPARRQDSAARTTGADVLVEGEIGSGDYMKLYADGTFTIGRWNPSAPDQLIAFSYDSDSMRRKSVTGRTAAAFASGGYSLAASNNRGVLYVTVTGRKTSTRTFTTRNPSNAVLSSVRAIKAVADGIHAHNPAPRSTVAPTPASDLASQLDKLVQLHTTGALTDEEFANAKRRLLE